MTAIDIIRESLRKNDGCETRHVESVAIREEHDGQVAWEGVVEVFELYGHPDATVAYGWRYRNDEGRMVTSVVFGLDWINSPREAVRASLVAKERLKTAQWSSDA